MLLPHRPAVIVINSYRWTGISPRTLPGTTEVKDDKGESMTGMDLAFAFGSRCPLAPWIQIWPAVLIQVLTHSPRSLGLKPKSKLQIRLPPPWPPFPVDLIR